ncbi:DUF885 domain-containing protein [Sphingopyxis fribergensis]
MVRSDRKSALSLGFTGAAILSLLVTAPLAAAEPEAAEAFRHIEQAALALQHDQGGPAGFVDYSPAGFRDRMARTRALLARLETIDRDRLTHDDQVTLDIMRWDAERDLELEPYQWLLFPYTPYEFNFRGPNPVLEHFVFADDADVATYLRLVGQYPKAIDSIAAHVRGQIGQGIYLQRDSAASVETSFAALARAPEQSFAWPKDARLQRLTASAKAKLFGALKREIPGTINPALTRFAKLFGSDYQAKAPTRYGLAQYPGGKEYYRVLVKRNLTLDQTPEELFRESVAALDRIASELRALRAEMGHVGSRADFEAALLADPRFKTSTPAEVERVYLGYMRRIDPFMDKLFCRPAPFGYGVARASPTQEAALTYGYAAVVRDPSPRGMYFYNGSDLDKRSLLPAQALIYHELAPGHYWQEAMAESARPAGGYPRRNMAFAEGWGDFAQTLAFEQGVFRTPAERYGRRVFNAMFHARAVADIGINYYGYSFEWGQKILAEHTQESDMQNRRSLIRDTTDWPAQILPYSFGSQAILRLREKARSALGDRFSEPRFYDSLLRTAPAPFPVLDRHIDWFIEQERGSGAPGLCR